MQPTNLPFLESWNPGFLLESGYVWIWNTVFVKAATDDRLLLGSRERARPLGDFPVMPETFRALEAGSRGGMANATGKRLRGRTDDAMDELRRDFEDNGFVLVPAMFSETE